MISQYTQTGQFHRTQTLPCQDVIFLEENSLGTVIALADGASACTYSHIGARIACREATRFLGRHGGQLKDFSDQKAAFLLLEQICSALKNEALCSGAPWIDYGSTLLSCYIPKNESEAFFYMLGDGNCCRVRNGICSPLAPVSKKTEGCPLTVTKDADKAMHIFKTLLKPKDAVFLCSDGTAEVCRDAHFGGDLIAAFSLKDFEAAKNILKSADHTDDCSFVAYIRE